MQTVTLDVGAMASMLDYQGVEKQLQRIPGVRRVAASVVSNSATIEYDERIVRVAALRAAIENCGFHCTGRILPKHACAPATETGAEHLGPDTRGLRPIPPQ